ncbi:MAG: hypothetical protein ACK5X3_23555 [Pseudomonadota bacterium]|jgi:hypothetical protein
MNSVVVASLVRHILTAAGGGFFVAWGLDGEMVNAAVGAVATLAGVAWAVFDKRRPAG